MQFALLTREHLAAIGALAEDRDVQRFTRIPAGASAVEEWLTRYESGRRDGTREAFAILEPDFVGLAVAPRIERDARTVELGYVIAPGARGLGLATAALRMLSQWAFSSLGALRLELLIGIDNEASKAVARRAGYVREGILRSLHVRDDVRADTELWSLLPTDPQA